MKGFHCHDRLPIGSTWGLNYTKRGYVWSMGIQKTMWGTPNHKASPYEFPPRVYRVYKQQRLLHNWLWIFGFLQEWGTDLEPHYIPWLIITFKRLNLGIRYVSLKEWMMEPWTQYLGRQPLWAHRHLRIQLHHLQFFAPEECVTVAGLQLSGSLAMPLWYWKIHLIIWYSRNRGKAHKMQ